MILLLLLYNNIVRKFIPENAKLIPKEATKVFEGRIYDVYQWPQKMFDGSTETFEMLGRADTVKIIALVNEKELATLQNIRNEQIIISEHSKEVVDPSSDKQKIIITLQTQPRKDWFYDYPGGRMDAEDKDELEAAKRELREETGLEFKNWKLVGVYQPFTKIDWLVYTFVASGLIMQTQQKLDAGEKIEVLAVSLPELHELAKSNDSQFLRFKGFEKIKSIDELFSQPELYKY